MEICKQDEEREKEIFRMVADSLMYHANVHVYSHPTIARNHQRIHINRARLRNINLPFHAPNNVANLEIPFFNEDVSSEEEDEDPQRYI